MKSFITSVLGILAFASTAIAADSPVGNWTTIDDKTHQPRAVIKITDQGGVLSGTVVKVHKQEGDTGVCGKCPGAFKDKPIQGLTILWGMKPSGDNKWDGGQILDAKSGKIYRCKMALKGNTLDVRGYVGISLLGRTQTWVRQ